MLITVLLIAAIVLCGLFMSFAIFKAVTGPQNQRTKEEDDDKKYGSGDPYDYSDPDSIVMRED
mgnify:CR=1 FL=1